VGVHEEHLGAYLEAALDCVVLADASGRVVEFNPAAERTFGYTREEALERMLAELIVPPSLRERHRRAFARFTQTHEQRVFGQRLELTAMRADGSEFPVELALGQVSSEPLLICGAIRDLTDAKRAERDLRRLADEQAALRRVATLVAEQPYPTEVFRAVTEAVGPLLGAGLAAMAVFPGDGTATTVAGWSAAGPMLPIGTRLQLDGDSVAARIFHTGTPARIDSFVGIEGQAADVARGLRLRSAVGAPILVGGRLWGALLAATRSVEPLPEDAERRIAAFTELVATAIANTEARHELEQSREALIVSRARIVAAGDEARRRIERNLHDGTQQRLIALGLDVQTVLDSIPADQQDAQSGLERIRHELEAVLEDVRELSHGLHPALLSQAGLGPSLRELARKSPVPVKLNVSVSERPSESTETAIYYVISEALANAAKHAHASQISVVLTTSGNEIRTIIEDDGSGGAEASAGSGLAGLLDRIEALGGRFALDSPPGHGTRISIEMPLTAEPIDSVARVPGGRRSTPADGRPPPPELSKPMDAALHAAIAASADALYIVDAQGRIRFLNPAALRILGYEDERQLLGRPSHDTIHYLRRDGTPFPAAECPLLRPRLNGETVRVEEDWFVRQDGSLAAVSYSSAPIALPDGRWAVVSFREAAQQRPG